MGGLVRGAKSANQECGMVSIPTILQQGYCNQCEASDHQFQDQNCCQNCTSSSRSTNASKTSQSVHYCTTSSGATASDATACHTCPASLGCSTSGATAYCGSSANCATSGAGTSDTRGVCPCWWGSWWHGHS